MLDAVRRARERGLESLSDSEVLSIAMGCPASRAARLIERAGGLAGLVRPVLDAERPALRVMAAFELGRRLHRSHEERGMRFPHAPAVARWADHLKPLEHEELWMLALDARHRLRAARKVAMGGLTGLHVAVRDPLRLALREAASAFVLVHNHPSGDPTPSAEDISFTRRLAAAAEVMGTPLLDHVVVGREGFTSMLDAGLLDPPQKSASCAPRASAGG